MALKGLDIFKLTPKTNCKECGSPTCMAFAMKVAQGAVASQQVSAYVRRSAGYSVRGNCSAHEDHQGWYRRG